MIKTSLEILHKAIQNSVVHGNADIVGVTTDSRKIQKGNLFVALRGEKYNAHDFLLSVQEAGAAAAIVEYIPEGCSLPLIVVENTQIALADIASHWRSQFILPVIGVTGSNGKTTVKEMIASILKSNFGLTNMLSTQGNLNNEIGVPLTVLQLGHEHKAAVIELGMNHPGEISFLTSIAQPTVALVNNAQREHQEFMQNVEAVAIENGAAILGLPENGVAVFPANDQYSVLWQKFANTGKKKNKLTFGLTNDADIRGQYISKQFGSELQIFIGAEKIDVNLGAAGEHNVLNALAAAACCHAIGIAAPIIATGLERFQPVAGRLQPKQARCGGHIIDDTYNANPDSVRAAIDVLAKVGTRNILVLGDMGEVGEDGIAFHQEIGAYAQSQGITQLFTLGELAKQASLSFGDDAQHFTDIESLQYALDCALDENSTLLVKGSRFMKMERVVAYLIDQSTNQSMNQSAEGKH